ncbi:ankyrin repeat-containing domain protein [Coprinopsis sp. MPI-PUGE-AT-0042]|nr:ankyrin repeat-containing domain protein [Coprinopsis sp. MPI-PUGE-AT-0042]
MRAEDRPMLVSLLASLDAMLFVTSRPLEALQRQFPQAHLFNIAASASDLDLHIKDVLRHSPEVLELLEGTDLEERIVEAIHRKSGGMFLHAKLQLEALRRCTSALDVEETLDTFPTDIDTIYEKTWERILDQEPKHLNLAKLVLLWVTHAHGEMTIDTLRCAVATSPVTHEFEPKRMVPEGLLLSVCCGLVSVDARTRLVRFIHYTTRDAIVPRILESFPLPHGILAHVCITYLKNSGVQNMPSEDASTDRQTDLRTRLRSDGLLAYTYRSWVHHTRLCNQYAPVVTAVANLVLNCTTFPFGNKSWDDFGGPLHVAAFHGLRDVIPLAARFQSPNVQTLIYEQSSLMLAVEGGHPACAKALLFLPGIDVNIVDRYGRNALMEAARYGQVESVQILLEAPGIDGNAADEDGWTALMHAAHWGHTETVKLLLGFPRVDTNAKGEDVCTALIHAVIEGHREVVEVLLGSPDIDANEVGVDGCTALMYAALGGRIEIVQLILGFSGTDVNAVDEDGWTAVIHAACMGHTEVVNLLLERTDIDVVDERSWTAFIRETALNGSWD